MAEWVDPLQPTWSDWWGQVSSPSHWRDRWNGAPISPYKRQTDILNSMPQDQKDQQLRWLLNEQGVDYDNQQEKIPPMLAADQANKNRNQGNAHNLTTTLETLGNFVSPSVVDLLKHPEGPRFDKSGHIVNDQGGSIVNSFAGVPVSFTHPHTNPDKVDVSKSANLPAYFADKGDPRYVGALQDLAMWGSGDIEGAALARAIAPGANELRRANEVAAAINPDFMPEAHSLLDKIRGTAPDVGLYTSSRAGGGTTSMPLTSYGYSTDPKTGNWTPPPDYMRNIRNPTAMAAQDDIARYLKDTSQGPFTQSGF